VESKLLTFEQAVRRYSDEPGAKERGGLIQMNRNEKNYDPAFMSAAFRLKEGELSQIVKTKFGYHLIMMIQRNGDDVVVRHLIKVPPVTDDEMNAGLSSLDSVRAKLIAGTIDFNAAAGKYSQDEIVQFAGPFIQSSDGDTYNRIDELDKDVVAQLGKLKVGEFSQPAVFVDERSQKKGVRILYLKSRSEPHRMNLRDDYNKISQAALEEKKYIVLDKWLTTHIPNYYIMIDPEAGDCQQLKKWSTVQKDTAGF
jgi:peptidyl-prolyl cis-trans isomerase SurA